MARTIMIDLVAIWENHIADVIEDEKEHLDFTAMSCDEFKKECLDLLIDYFDHEMLGDRIDYRALVLDTAKACEMLQDG